MKAGRKSDDMGSAQGRKKAASIETRPLPDEADPAEAADAPGLEPEVRTRIVDAAWHGQRLDKALVGLAPEFSRSHLQHLIDGGHARLDGVVQASASRRVQAGQELSVELVPTEESRAFTPQPMALVVLHEDEHLLVVDKPAGLVVHPAPGHWSGTLLNGLLAHHAAAATLPRGGIVHRLDKDTSGLMLVGKSLPAVTALVRDIGARAVRRQYLAIAEGRLPAAAFDIDEPIGRDPRQRLRMAVVAGGRPARTSFEHVASDGALHGLRCTLHTGRTHQIRVHLRSAGLPLVGDALYGGRPALGLQRQALHAHVLRLEHPLSRAPLAFECPPPADFAAAWRQLGAD
jgi:23S rRNA pseudouridine1911/1915/1917 synthase